MAINPNKKRSQEFKGGDRLSASWVQKIENFVTSFKVLSGGHFIFDGRTAALQIYGNQNIWSGRVFFGGELVNVENIEVDQNGVVDKSNWANTHVKINLKTGEATGADWDEKDTADLAEYEFYSVATKTQNKNGDNVYTFNSNTVGDIHCRITWSRPNKRRLGYSFLAGI